MSRRAMGRAVTDLGFHEIIFRYLNTAIRNRHQYLELLPALQSTVEAAPDHSFALASLAAAYIHDFNYMFDAVPDPLDRALALSRQAVALNPDSQRAELYLAYAYVQRGEIEQFFVHADRCLELNPHAPFALGAIGLCMTLAGQWEKGVRLVRRAMDLNPGYSRYLHHAPFMDCMRRGDYAAALVEARLFNVPGFFWAPLVRAAVLGKLGMEQEGNAAVRELLSLRPDFAQRAEELIHRFVHDDTLVSLLLDGLAACGFSREVQPAGAWL